MIDSTASVSYNAGMSDSTAWPELSFEAWQDTYATLHRWTQIVGKVRLARTPWINHSWHVTLYPTARGLTTSPIPDGARTFEIAFDFIDHHLVIGTSDGAARTLRLGPRSVAEFYGDVQLALRELGIDVRIYGRPNELEDALPFAQDTQHASYDPEYAQRCWRIVARTATVMQEFRARFLGKCSPIHFFWGSFDLAVTRFSGRPAPPHPGGVPNLPDWVAREAYSHEVSSCGFWPGGGPARYPLFYAYAYPEPPGFATAPVTGGAYHAGLREFVLPYDDVRSAAEPERVLLEFLQTTYEAAANAAAWDRAALERTAPPRRTS